MRKLTDSALKINRPAQGALELLVVAISSGLLVLGGAAVAMASLV